MFVVSFCSAATCLTAFVASWLLRRASTSYIWRVAGYAALVWAQMAAQCYAFVSECNGSADRVAGVLLIAWLLLSFSTSVVSYRLALGRITAIEASALQPLGAVTLRRLLLGIGLGVVCLVVLFFTATATRISAASPVFSCFGWLFIVALAAFMARATLIMHSAWRFATDTAENATGRRRDDAKLAAQILRQQIYGLVACTLSTWIGYLMQFLAWGFLSPIPGPSGVVARSSMLAFPSILDSIFNTFAALLFSGAFSGALQGGDVARKAKRQRRKRWRESSATWMRHQDPNWHQKVEELAGRGFTLDALIQFYKGLGKDYMEHFKGGMSTTADVVRSAIIPLSREQRCAYSEVMMRGACLKPAVMVTHGWGNIFSDLVAAILADALDEIEYDMIAYMLGADLEQLETWVKAAGVGSRSYWVCALCVNQHAGICGGNPYKAMDTVTGTEYSLCDCGLPKAFNDTEPVLNGDGPSIPCEMNKFDDMMQLISAENQEFAQVIAIDASFVLFSRACCCSLVFNAIYNKYARKSTCTYLYIYYIYICICLCLY